MIKPDIFLEKTEQDSLREKLGAGNTISQALAKSAEYLEEGKGWAESFLESMPWLKDIAEAAEEFKVVAFVLKLSKRWLDTAHPYELGAVACTVAYQQAAPQRASAGLALGHRLWPSLESGQAGRAPHPQFAARRSGEFEHLRF